MRGGERGIPRGVLMRGGERGIPRGVWMREGGRGIPRVVWVRGVDGGSSRPRGGRGVQIHAGGIRCRGQCGVYNIHACTGIIWGYQIQFEGVIISLT